MKITLNGTVEAADAEAKTITGRVLPFGELGRPKSDGLGPIVFSEGSVNIADPAAIKLNLEHDRTRPIGRAVTVENRADGIWATFELVDTTAARDALAEAAAGLRAGLSIEVTARELDRQQNITYVLASDLTGVALVTNPAYAGAGVTSIAAVDDEETSDEVPNVSEAESAAEDVSDEGETVENTTTPDAPTVEASAAPAANLNGGPVTVKARTGITDEKSYLKYALKAYTSNDPEYTSWVRAHEAAVDAYHISAADDDTTTNTGLTLANHLPMFISTTTGAEPVAEACGGYMTLPEYGMSFTIPRLTTAPTFATTAENGVFSETGATSNYITVGVAKTGGRNEVTPELAERSNPAFLQILDAELNNAYAKNMESILVALLTAGGTQASTQAGTVAGLQAFVGTEAVAAWTATGGDFATELVANGSWWTALINANDSTNRPLFPEIGPMNAPGDVSSRSDRGNVFGQNLYVSPNLVSGLIDESAFLINRSSVMLWRSPLRKLQIQRTTDGIIEVAKYSYYAGAVVKAGGVRRFNLT